MVQEVLLLLKALLITVLVLVLAYWFTRHMAGRMAGGSRVRGRCITVLEQVSVGKESKLLLARLGDRLYFLAMTPGGITILREVTEEEAASWTGELAGRDAGQLCPGHTSGAGEEKEVRRCELWMRGSM